MIVESNALCSRLPTASCRLSATRQKRLYAVTILPRRAYAVRTASNYRRDTILQGSEHGPASTCWSLLSSSSAAIASNLPSLRLRKAKLKSGKTPLVVLFVTPAHIRLLDGDSESDNAFIPSLLQLAFEQTKPWQEFDLLAAVVDRIPLTSSGTSYRVKGSHTPDVDTPSKPCLGDGFEGISVAVLDSETAAPDLWSPRDRPKERETMTIQQRCTLSFSLPPSPGEPTQLSDKAVSQPLVKRMLQLPVANTLFQNGRTSTLFAQKWVLSFRKEPTSEPMSSEKTWLPQQTLHMDALFADDCMQLRLDTLVHSRLVPITPARTITAAVGNIVRELGGGDDSAEAAPASEELERAISIAIQQGQIPAQQAGVWALIRPQRYAALDQPAELQGTVRGTIGHAILSGARLHKVLSGGGGWGKKHGLLALDPDSDYSYHHQTFGPSSGHGQDADVENLKALGEVAKLGDMITFYVYRSPSDADAANLGQPISWSRSQAVTATLVFGSIPSTVDAMPEVDISEAEGRTQSELAVKENYFGMLSEQGMNLESSFLNTNLTAHRMQHLRIELNRQNYEVRRRKTATTKLDAPYTTVSIRGRASRIPASRVKWEEHQASNVHLQDLMPPESPTEIATTDPAASLIDRLPKDSDQKLESQRSRIESEHPLVGKASIKDRKKTDRGKSNNDSRLAIRFTSPKQGPDREVTLKSEAQDAPPFTTIRKHLSASPEDSSQEHRLASKQNFDIWTEQERRSLKYRNKPESIPIIRELLASEQSFDFETEQERRYLKYGKQPEPILIIPELPAPEQSFDFETEQERRYLKYGKQPEPIPIIRELPAPEQSFDFGTEQERRYLKYGKQPDSVPIIREESEGKDPGTAYRGQGGNIFMVRKHFTMNPYERLQAIRTVGEITSREQAMGLHGAYHLVLEEQPEEKENAEVLDEKL